MRDAHRQALVRALKLQMRGEVRIRYTDERLPPPVDVVVVRPRPQLRLVDPDERSS